MDDRRVIDPEAPPGTLRARLLAIPGVEAVARPYRGARDILVRLFRDPAGFQTSNMTFPHRYPVVFARVRARIDDDPDRHILSFGCSTGDEVFSLAELFPAATIRGLDIKPRNIAACETRWRAEGGDPRLSFAVAASAAEEPPERYDAVFAMAVFRHGGLRSGPPRADRHIRFEDFARSVALLARCVRPGGLLIFRFSHFRFSDTPAAADFEKVLGFPKPVDNAIYGPDDRSLPADTPSDDGIFRKRGGV